MNYYSYKYQNKSKLPKVIGVTKGNKKGRKQRSEKIKKVSVVGFGEDCPKCKDKMQRREHTSITDKLRSQAYFYLQWDYCRKCKHIQHYEKYKIYNPDYQEYLRVDDFFRGLRNSL